MMRMATKQRRKKTHMVAACPSINEAISPVKRYTDDKVACI
jgi:hypothetical protein